MTAVAVLTVFSAGLLAGAALAMCIYVLVKRTTPGDTTATTDRMTELLAPLRSELERYDQRLSSFDRERAMQFGSLSEQLHNVAAASEGLRDQTQQLAGALRSPNVRGRWGELQLRRVVELSGMAEHCDFETQVSMSSQDDAGDIRILRPDLVVRLPGGRSVIIDAKAPLTAFLDAIKAPDERERSRLLRLHASQLRGHVDALARKGYWERGEGSTPEFVVLFLPGEAFFSSALEHDPALLDDSAARGVILATPTTLIALLRAVSFGWREVRIADGAREISALGATLYERLSTLGAHFGELGASLDRAVVSYNRAVGTLESRVFVTARRFQELGSAPQSTDMEPMTPVGSRTRAVQAPELLG